MNELISYVVEPGDSFNSIADKFNISVNSVIWANNLTKSSLIKPGMVIKIPPVSGLTYKVQAGETVKMVAEKFKVSEEKIREQNRLAVDQELLLDQNLLIPGAIRIVEPPKKDGALASNAAKGAADSAKKTGSTASKKPSVTSVPVKK